MNSDIKMLETLEDGMYSVTFSPDGSGSGEWLKLADDDDESDDANKEALAQQDELFRSWYPGIFEDGAAEAFQGQIKQFLANYLERSSQTKLKRSGKHLRQHNLARKRNAAHGLVGLDLVSENAHEHGSRAMRRKALHDARKGTKPGPFGRGSVKLTDVDLVERHGRASLVALSEDRFQKALVQLNADGRRLDLKPKSEFQRTVDALSEVLNRRVSV